MCEVTFAPEGRKRTSRGGRDDAIPDSQLPPVGVVRDGARFNSVSPRFLVKSAGVNKRQFATGSIFDDTLRHSSGHKGRNADIAALRPGAGVQAIVMQYLTLITLSPPASTGELEECPWFRAKTTTPRRQSLSQVKTLPFVLQQAREGLEEGQDSNGPVPLIVDRLIHHLVMLYPNLHCRDELTACRFTGGYGYAAAGQSNQRLPGPCDERSATLTKSRRAAKGSPPAPLGVAVGTSRPLDSRRFRQDPAAALWTDNEVPISSPNAVTGWYGPLVLAGARRGTAHGEPVRMHSDLAGPAPAFLAAPQQFSTYIVLW
ncbi:hypothetical protein CH63R_14477 [Colletotrichum higginsianum IMI 349063]|uniref:Uncharacterized protein n=1 Tax=Colletotrichum higginsianum (strain IMI 349063) TaxID=759273 RepID=A0A1B7XQZ4_COLHI|nr:hypothetical protein CH63R_14477 [Colletotrichum higginsianum IMI 349063]OBR02176.1 hypothetical protein CH63R_14477 [Colletotrichum higginsianum IMI 349063]